MFKETDFASGETLAQTDVPTSQHLANEVWERTAGTPGTRPQERGAEGGPSTTQDSALPKLSFTTIDTSLSDRTKTPGLASQDIEPRGNDNVLFEKFTGSTLAQDGSGPWTTADRKPFPVDAKGRHYHGEGIKRDIPPGIHEVRAGETLRTIARDHLGAGASAETVKKYSEELARINYLRKGEVTQGQVLNLPGHSADGTRFIMKDTEGNERVIYPDGSFDLKTKSGSEYSRFYDADGSYREYWARGDDQSLRGMMVRSAPDAVNIERYQETHSGPQLEDNYVIERIAEGKYKIKDQDGEKTSTKYDEANPDLRLERARLCDAAEKHVQFPEQLKRFQEDMATFEARSVKLEDTYKKQLIAQGTTPEPAAEQARKSARQEMARSYHELTRLMETTEFGSTELKPPMGAQIAIRTLFHLADPTTIDQGLHPTCQTSTVQARAFTNDPAKAARVIADATIKGSYTTPDGKTTVQIDPNVLNLGPRAIEARDPSLEYPPRDSARSYVSHLWQYTAINVELQRTGLRDGDGTTTKLPPGRVRYEQREPNFSANPPDNGERLVDISDPKRPKIITETDKRGAIIAAMAPNLTDDQITDMSNAMTNRNEKAVVLTSRDYIAGDSKGIQKIESEEALNKALQEAKNNGRLPIIVRVDAKNAPFWGESGGGAAAGSAAAHVITITDYQPAEPGPPARAARIEVDNQWGKDSDHTGDNAMLVSQLFAAMHRSGGTFMDKDQDRSDQSLPMPSGGRYFIPVDGVIDILQKQADSGKATAATQLELIRQKVIHDSERKKQSKLDYPPFFKDAKELETATTKTYADALKKFAEQKATGDVNYNSKDEKSALAAWNHVLNELTPESKKAVEKQVKAEMDAFFRARPHLKPKSRRPE